MMPAISRMPFRTAPNFCFAAHRMLHSAPLKTPFFVIDPMNGSAFKNGVSSLYRSPYTDYPILLSELGAIFKKTMNAEVCSYLKDMGKYEISPLLLLKNCPINPNPGPTPDIDKHTPAKGFTEEFFILGLVKTLNTKPHHEHFEKHGELIAQIVALKDHETEQSSRGTAEFPYHTEHIHLENPIRFLSLFCIKGDPEARTRVLTVDDCVKNLSRRILETLQIPIFEMRTGPTWNGRKVHRIAPILQPDGCGSFYIQYNNDLKNRVVPKTRDASLTLDYFSKHLENVPFHEVSLEAGDCLIINNRKTLHRRDAYTPSTPSEDRRWVMRMYMDDA